MGGSTWILISLVRAPLIYVYDFCELEMESNSSCHQIKKAIREKKKFEKTAVKKLHVVYRAYIKFERYFYEKSGGHFYGSRK